MPRIARMFIKGEELIYHIVSRTALSGYVIGEADKDYFGDILRHLSKVYFVEVLGYSIMSTHFHLVIRMKSGKDRKDEEIERRFDYYYNSSDKKIKRVLGEGQIPYFQGKMEQSFRVC